MRLAAIACLTALLAAPASAGAPAEDPVAETWRARAALASKRLSTATLDACDRGVEEAFRAAAPVAGEEGRREWALAIRVDGKQLLVSYGYQGRRLDTFSIAALPEGWFAYQKADSKTLTVLLSAGSKCALDLCTAGPTADGPCAAPRR